MTSTTGSSTSASGICAGKPSLMNVSGSIKSTSSLGTPNSSSAASIRYNANVAAAIKSAGSASGNGPPPAPSSGAATVSATIPTSVVGLRLYRSRSNTDSDLQNNIQPQQSQHHASGIRRQLFSVGGFLAPSTGNPTTAIASIGATTTGPSGLQQASSGVDSMQPQASPYLQQISYEAGSSVLPSHIRRRLYELFGLIEKEFETLHAENAALRTKVEALTERLTEGGALAPDKAAEILEITAGDIFSGSAVGKPSSAKKASHVGQKLKTAFRVPAPGRNLVSSFKANVQLGGGSSDASRIRFVNAFLGHRDGVWDADVACLSSSSSKNFIVGSASADQTARVWFVETGALLLVYAGHAGSVNDISFHTATGLDNVLAVTASGDQSAHIWKVVAPNLPPSAMAPLAQQTHSSEDELEQPYSADRSAIAEESAGDDGETHSYATTIRTPLMQLTGHTSAVIAVDWIYGGDQIITASWDRTANVYDVERGEILNVLTGHDQELNHCCAHSSRKLVVTSSKDTTFRLWDFRDPIYSVAVFQGHNESVTSAVFSSGDKVVSGSDDRTVKVWDLKNMRTALATIRTDSAVNRLALSQQHNIIAIPHDNRNVRLYDLNGNRVGRLPRSSRRGHRRMACAAIWADDSPNCNLFTCGFDKQLLGWKVATNFGKEKD